MRPKRDGLNIVPFIDVMLVLLAIVLSVSTFIAQGGIKVELANSKNAVTLPNIDKALVISVDDSNNIYINNKISSINEVENSNKNINKDTFVEIRNDKNSKFETFISIIDVLKTHKHENFTIALEKNE